MGRWKNLEDAVYARYFAETLLFGEYRSTQNDAVILQLVTKCMDTKRIEEYVMGKVGNFVDSTHKY